MSAITASDIKFHLTTKSGAAGNTTASTGAASLGKYAATTLWSGTIRELFDDVSGAENAASQTEYRGIYVENGNASNALQNAVIYLQSEVAGGSTITVAVDNIVASAVGASAAQGAEIASDTTAPTGVGAFSSPTAGSPLALGNIPVGYGRMVWIKRAAGNTSAVSNDGAVIAVTGDTGSL